MNQKIKRFYTDVDVTSCETGFMVELDKRAVKSPGRQILVLPNKQLAQSLAMEWRNQEGFIDRATMPVLNFAGLVTDSIIPLPDDARAEILKYAHSDLLCYRAGEPDTLIAKQQRLWGPVLEQYKQDESIEFKTSTGIQYVEQECQDMKRFAALIAPLEGYELGGALVVTTMCGSAVLAMALVKGWFSADVVWELCHIDEDYQIEKWGSDSEEEERRQQRYTDFCAATQIFLKS